MARLVDYKGKILVLKYNIAVECRVPIDGNGDLGYAIVRVLNQSGLTAQPNVDPASIKFTVED